MAKITKKAAILETLHSLVNKEAELAQTNISGEPCKDTKVTSVSEETETTNKNDVGPDKLNNEQGYEQKPSSDSSEPVAHAKSASVDVEKLANDILSTIQTKIAENAQTNISGTPLKDTKATSVSDETETTDKNAVGADKLNKEQGYEQEGSKDSSEPSKAKSAEEITKEKQASYDLGVAFCDALLKKAAEIKSANEIELYKEADHRPSCG